MKTVAETFGMARSNLIERRARVTKPRGRYRKVQDAGLLPLSARSSTNARPMAIGGSGRW